MTLEKHPWYHGIGGSTIIVAELGRGTYLDFIDLWHRRWRLWLDGEEKR